MTTSAAPIICGVDFSERSRRALAAARELGDRLSHPVIAVSAVDERLAKAGDRSAASGSLADETRRELERVAAETATGYGAGIETRVAVGPAWRVLHDAARVTSAAMIVVGTRGHGRARRLFAGSTTCRLLVDAPVPVLAIPGERDERDEAMASPPIAFDQVICGVDFAPASLAAARAAVALGQEIGVPVTLVTVVPSPSGPPSWSDALRRAAADDADQSGERLAALAAELEGPPATRVMVGSPAEMLLDAIEGSGRALLVVGIGGGRTHQPGSTAIRLLTQGQVPVLAIPA